MGIDKFIYVLFLFSIMILFYEKELKVVEIDNQEKPEISFYNSTAYDITTVGIETIVKSNEAYFYKTREELISGTVISNDDGKSGRTNIVSGDHFIKIKDQLFIDGDVNLQLENDIDITTEQIEYNIKTKIAKNSLPFKAIQYDNTFNGKNLYVNLEKKYLKSINTKMKIKVTDE